MSRQSMLLVARLHGLLTRESAQTLAEYGLILALVAIACIVALGLLGTALSGILQDVVAAL